MIGKSLSSEDPQFNSLVLVVRIFTRYENLSIIVGSVKNVKTSKYQEYRPIKTPEPS